MRLLLISLLVLAWTVQAVQAQPKAEKGKGIDAQTVVAFEKLGCGVLPVCWSRRNDSLSHYGSDIVF